MVFVLDNYDSFTYNLVQYLGELGAKVEVYRNDELTVEQVEALKPERILLSPGPCTPSEAGILVPLIRHMAGKTPIFGVCLGHQAIGEAFGGQVVRAQHLMHGKTSPVEHDGKGIFAGLPTPLTCTRYHSLIVAEDSLPGELVVTARTQESGGGSGERPDRGRAPDDSQLPEYVGGHGKIDEPPEPDFLRKPVRTSVARGGPAARAHSSRPSAIIGIRPYRHCSVGEQESRRRGQGYRRA